MKILLVQPPIHPDVLGAGVVFLNEPLALETIAACVPDQEIKLLDMTIEPNLHQELEAFQPDVVGTTSYTASVHAAEDILREAKKYNQEILTVVGGHHPTLMPQDFNKEFIDVIVIGEGEITFKELIETYEKGRNLRKVNGLALSQDGKLLLTPSRGFIEDWDEMPFPARNLTKKYRQHYFRGKWRPAASMITSRGCPFRCDFCAMWKIMGGKYRVRHPESVVNELSTIEEKYIDIVDDNTLHDVKRAERLPKMIKERGIQKIYKLYARSDTVVKRPDIIEKWKEIGMQLILIGFESFRDEELETRNKHNTVRTNEEAIHILQENDVEIAAYFLIDPDYTKEDFEALGDYVERMRLTHPVFTILTPFPGTDLFERRYNEINLNYELFDFFHSVLPTKLPLKEFYQCFADLYRRCYSPKGDEEKGHPIFSEETIQRFYASLAKIC